MKSPHSGTFGNVPFVPGVPEMLVRCLPGAYLENSGFPAAPAALRQRRTASELVPTEIRHPDRLTTRLMRCDQCGAESDERARGWRAMLGLEDDDTVVTVVLCPVCAERDFGTGPSG